MQALLATSCLLTQVGSLKGTLALAWEMQHYGCEGFLAIHPFKPKACAHIAPLQLPLSSPRRTSPRLPFASPLWQVLHTPPCRAPNLKAQTSSRVSVQAVQDGNTALSSLLSMRTQALPLLRFNLPFFSHLPALAALPPLALCLPSCPQPMLSAKRKSSIREAWS